jgi:hypothetical protein
LNWHSRGQAWTPTTAPDADWYALVSSADGRTLVAAIGGSGGQSGPIFTSTNSGGTWTPADGPNPGYLVSVASSANGTWLWAASYDPVHHAGSVYSSTNSGTSWSANNIGPVGAIYCSADGSKLVTAGAGAIYFSTNGGASWGNADAPATNWTSVAGSADGTRLVAAASIVDVPGPYSAGPVCTSADGGATWTLTSAPINIWRSVASSADGTRLVAAVSGGPIYVSTNAGQTWNVSGAPAGYWYSVASSADGAQLVAAGAPGVYTSADSGATWLSNNVPAQQWHAVAASADATRLVAAAQGGGIWTKQLDREPLLSLAPSGAKEVLVSWTVPSLDFALQAASSLPITNWSKVANAPILNFNTLRYQVLESPTNGSRFYRLKH